VLLSQPSHENSFLVTHDSRVSSEPQALRARQCAGSHPFMILRSVGRYLHFLQDLLLSMPSSDTKGPSYFWSLYLTPEQLCPAPTARSNDYRLQASLLAAPLLPPSSSLASQSFMQFPCQSALTFSRPWYSSHILPWRSVEYEQQRLDLRRSTLLECSVTRND
jgi:hypothetical protein